MKIFLKFLFRNILSKKLRTLLILVSIILSTALVFATLAMSGTASNMVTKQMKKYYGTAEIAIRRDLQSLNDPFFEIQDLGDLDQNIDYMIGRVQGFATYPDKKDLDVFLSGYSIQDLKTIYDTEFIDEPANFSGYEAVIGQGEAKAMGADIGDKFTLKINKQTYEFIVKGIAKPEGLFKYDTKTLSIIVPKETLSSIYGSDGLINIIYIKTKDIEVQSMIDLLKEKYGDDFLVTQTVSTAALEANVSNLTTTLALMLIIVLFISVFIIYTAFKVITMERLPIVGTFRSIGATKKTTDLILLGESIIYGIVGGLLGCVLGFGILNLMAWMIAYDPYSGVTSEIELIYGAPHLLIAFIFAVVLSVISAMLPIIRIGKMPVRNIVLNQVRIVVKNTKTKMIIGLLIIAIPFILLSLSKESSIFIGALCIVSTGAGIVLLTPYITRLFVFLFEHINGFLFKNEGILAAKNLRNNKSVINNITLLAIGIAALLAVNLVSTSVANEVGNVFDDANFELAFIYSKIDEPVEDKLESIDGVDKIESDYSVTNIKYLETGEYINYVWGVNPASYFDFWQIDFVGNKDKILSELKDNGIVISTVVRDKYNLKVGEEMTLSFKNGSKKYQIVGITNCLLNNGNYIFINENTLKQDAKLNYYNETMIKTNNVKAVTNAINKEFETDSIRLINMDEQRQNNLEANNQIFQMLNAFSFITMLIGIFGIFNNFVVSLISRRRSIAVYRSVGMSKNQVMKMLVVESLGMGTIGGIIGIFSGLFLIKVTDYIMKALYLPITIKMTPWLFISALLIGIVVSVISALIPSIRSKKINIIEAIKYE